MERKLSAIFSTDVKGYSRLMGDDEEATIRTIKAYRVVISGLIEQYHGRVVDSPGDNMLAEFPSAVDAVKSSVAIQHELKTRNAELEDHRKMEFRIGLNVGDVIADEGRLYGDGVNIAARLKGLADPGGICISDAVHTQVQNKLSLQYAYIGEREVKNIAKPVPVYKVQLEADGTPATVSQERPARSPDQETGLSRRWPIVSLAVMAVLVVGAGLFVLRNVSLPPSALQESLPGEPAPALPLPDKPSIAVLPFNNMSGDPAQEYFSDGITETLITDLSQISGLFVIARNSTFTYKGQAVKVDQVGRELGVRHVLEGSVQRVDERVRINAQLVDATTGGHVWAERYDRELHDVFTLQDEITQKIAFALQVTLTPDEQERFRQAPTDNLDAYRDYLRGQTLFWHMTKDSTVQARQLFEHALELDPQYAAAYAMLGSTYFLDWVSQWSQDPQTPERAWEFAHKALDLNDSLAGPHLLLGQLYLFKNRQHDQALAAVERAIALAPNDETAYMVLGWVLIFAGQPEKAIEALEQSIRLNPQHPAHCLVFLAEAYYWLRQYEEGIAAAKKALLRRFDKDNVGMDLGAHIRLAAIYGELGREEEAQGEVAETLRLSPQYTLEGVRQTTPYKDPADIERVITALRKAGFK